jgi:acyl-CoA synthetase (AMP-forming)/AMP-acid ligase II
MNALFHRATTSPDGTAFIYDAVVWTYHDLLTGAEQLSRAFLARGVRPGDRVVLHMSNRPEMAVAVYACFRVGAIACPTNLRFKTAELREIFQRLQPALYLGEEQLYSHVETIEPEILVAEKRFVTGSSGAYKGAMPWSALLVDSAGAGAMPAEPDKDAPAILLTTSGTTVSPSSSPTRQRRYRRWWSPTGTLISTLRRPCSTRARWCMARVSTPFWPL